MWLIVTVAASGLVVVLPSMKKKLTTGNCSVEDDVQGDVTAKFRDALLELFYRVASRTGDPATFLIKPSKEKTKSKPIIVPVVDSGDLL